MTDSSTPRPGVDAPGAEPASPAAAAARHAARQRLLGAALRLFAQQGYALTSTREIAEAAGVNVAAISYYFGDKAGLYRAAFFEPLCGRAEPLTFGDAPLAQALAMLFADLIAPLRSGEASRLCMRLRFREMFEPTGLWEEELRRDIAPLHAALVAVLQRHLGAPAPDAEIHRLAVCIFGLGVQLHVGRDCVELLAPQLHVGPRALDDWAARLVDYALAMVDAEARRRAAVAGAQP